MSESRAEGTLTVRAARPYLVLRNETSTTVGYVVLDSDMMTITRYPPTSTDGPVLAVGEELMMPLTAIAGYSETSTAVNVKWWHWQQSADGALHADGPMHTVSVALD